MSNHPLKIIHVTVSVSRLAGGLFESIRHLSHATAKCGMEVEIVGVEDEFAEADAERWLPLKVYKYPVYGPPRWAFSPGLMQHLEQSDADIIHLHGVWQYPTSAVLRWARRTGKPYIISAHGMLEPWALQQARFKKAIVNWLYQNTCLQLANCLRATAESEVESIRKIGLRNPVALIGNGVFVPERLGGRRTEGGGQRTEDGEPVSDLRSSISALGATRRALFISRIHPKKGLLDLVRAWSLARKRQSEDRGQRAEDKARRTEGGGQTSDICHPISGVGHATSDLRPPASGLRSPISDPWELVIMGPDEGGHLGEVMALVKELGLQEQIKYGGEVWDDAGKWRCYQEADLFVLPSYSENFGLVIAEALGCGVPVITTKATPWQDLETHRCGWWIDTGVEPVRAALQQAMATPAEELRAMGLRGRELIQRKYSWAPIGKQMAETYQWLAGRRERPEWVIG